MHSVFSLLFFSASLELGPQKRSLWFWVWKKCECNETAPRRKQTEARALVLQWRMQVLHLLLDSPTPEVLPWALLTCWRSGAACCSRGRWWPRCRRRPPWSSARRGRPRPPRWSAPSPRAPPADADAEADAEAAASSTSRRAASGGKKLLAEWLRFFAAVEAPRRLPSADALYGEASALVGLAMVVHAHVAFWADCFC